MLTVHPQHVTRFSAVAEKNFEDHVLAHLRKFFPQECDERSEEDLRDLIRSGTRRAAAYGITKQDDTCMYITLTLLLGTDFDTNPENGWAQAILAERRRLDPEELVNRLQKAAVDHLDATDEEITPKR